MNRWLREPLVHFLLLGAAFFGLYALLNSDDSGAPGDIVVTTGQIENIAAAFTRVWLRPPTPDELKEQIDLYVTEEALSREAIKLGLDQNDAVIRSRLRQKMEFLVEDTNAPYEPSEKELEDYLAKHPEQFAVEPDASGRAPALDEIRVQVRREFLNARRLEAHQRFIDDLLRKYRVTIQPLPPRLAPPAGNAATGQ